MGPFAKIDIGSDAMRDFSIKSSHTHAPTFQIRREMTSRIPHPVFLQNAVNLYNTAATGNGLRKQERRINGTQEAEGDP